jgi:hypothetical protein
MMVELTLEVVEERAMDGREPVRCEAMLAMAARSSRCENRI